MMMMQIGSTLPARSLNQSHSRRSSFKSHMSPLNPTLSRTTSSSRSTAVHLANLEKILAKPPPPPLREEAPLTTVPKNPSVNAGKAMLDGLNLARLWPESRSADEMSPGHLNRLQRLLSFSAESSPRNSLGGRWRDYHGANDWAGMLDPLDENLRREVIRYGEFVQAAYRCFHSNPETPADSPPSPRHVALPDKSYKVTKSLYATSSVGLPKWVDDVAPDLGWLTQRSSWFGYVAVCDDRREIHRMGRRDIVIALRGTATCLEWAENMRAHLVEVDPAQPGAKAEAGFLSLYQTPGAHVESLAEAVVEEVRRLMEEYEGETLSITVTGHSLGAALAVLVGDELSRCLPEVPPVAVVSFGSPRVGNRGFSDRVEERGVKVLRVVNSQDVITRVPGVFVGDGFDKRLKSTKLGGALMGAIEENMPLAYAHVGTELRVDTKMSPYLKPNADMACCHDLEAYLHLVDGYLASNCPFRSNAKRSLVRLLQDQRSNVKQLYTSKAKSLSLNLDSNRDRMPFHTCLPSPSS